MRLGTEQARARLVDQAHGVLCTLDPVRGPAPVPVVYAVAADHLAVPVDHVKAKTTERLRREDNLDSDPRAALLVEHWETEDWSRLWWVRADLEHVADPASAVVDGLAERLARTVPQYADRPFHRILVFHIVRITGWSAVESHSFS